MKYYKQRNVNEVLEYDVIKSLKKIESLISEKKEDYICSIFSALFANAITKIIDEKITNAAEGFVFIVIMLTVYCILKKVFHLVTKYNEWKQTKKTGYKMSDDKQADLRNVFFCKIANEIIFSTSLINRVHELRNDNKKEELWKIYLFQAKNCIERAGKLLHDSVPSFEGKQWDDYVELVGKEAIIWMIETVNVYSKKLNDIEPSIDINNGVCFMFKQLKV